MQTQITYHHEPTETDHIITVDATPEPADPDSNFYEPHLAIDNVEADPPLPIETLNTILEDRYDEIAERFSD